MAFDIGNGLSEMGKSLSQTFQAYSIEAQKAELEAQRLKLANELAMERESVGRRETAALAEIAAEKQRGWQSGENQADRKLREHTASEQNNNLASTSQLAVSPEMKKELAETRLRSEATKKRFGEAKGSTGDARLSDFDRRTLPGFSGTPATYPGLIDSWQSWSSR